MYFAFGFLVVVILDVSLHAEVDQLADRHTGVDPDRVGAADFQRPVVTEADVALTGRGVDVDAEAADGTLTLQEGHAAVGLGVLQRHAEVEGIGVQQEAPFRDHVVDDLVVRPGIEDVVLIAGDVLAEVDVVAVRAQVGAVEGGDDDLPPLHGGEDLFVAPDHAGKIERTDGSPYLCPVRIFLLLLLGGLCLPGRVAATAPFRMDTTVLAPAFDTLCRDDDPMIEARVTGDTYAWNVGLTTRSVPAPAGGTYIVTVTDAAGNVTVDEHRVTLVSVPNPVFPVIGPPGPYCEGQLVTVSVELAGYDSLVWTDGRGTTYPGFGPGNAMVEIPAVPGATITYVAFYETCREQLSVLPPLAFAEEDFTGEFSADLASSTDTVCLDSSFTLLLTGTQIDEVRWADGDSRRSRTFVAANGADYTVSVTTTCSDSVAVLSAPVALIDCTPPPDTIPCRGVFPEVFTPNLDGRNDLFRLFTDCALDRYQLRVFNRWGSLVFESNAADGGWDGTRNGTPQAPDVYYYVCEFTHDGVTERRDGAIILVR